MWIKNMFTPLFWPPNKAMVISLYLKYIRLVSKRIFKSLRNSIEWSRRPLNERRYKDVNYVTTEKAMQKKNKKEIEKKAFCFVFCVLMYFFCGNQTRSPETIESLETGKKNILSHKSTKDCGIHNKWARKWQTKSFNRFWNKTKNIKICGKKFLFF